MAPRLTMHPRRLDHRHAAGCGAVLALLLLLAGCGTGADRGAQATAGTTGGQRDAATASPGATSDPAPTPGRTYPLTGFVRVRLDGVDDIAVTVGPRWSVAAAGDPEALDALRLTVQGDTLVIGRVPGTSRGRADIAVSMPRIAGAAVAGTGDLSVDRVTDSFAGAVGGAGTLRLPAVAAERLALSLSGTGDIDARGMARQVTVDSGGAGDLAGNALAVSRATVASSGTGSVALSVDGPATVSASGTGIVALGPRARCRTASSGTATVRCG